MDREREAEEDSTPPSKADIVRAKLKHFASYAMSGFSPTLSVAALIVAVIAVTNNQSQFDRTQLNELTSRIASLNASMADTKGELENLKFSMGREKSMHGEERKKMDDRDTKIIQNVTRLQAKFKISPTLEEQLREVNSAPEVMPTVTNAASASAPAITATSQVIDKEKVTTAPASKSQEKTTAQAKALKEAIEKFNKK